MIGRTLPLNLVLARAEKAAVWIPALTVYPEGFEFEIEIRHRLDDEQFEHPFFMGHHLHHRRRRAASEELPAELLRLGVEFSDGRKATNLGGPHWLRPDDADAEPEGPLLQPAGGGGGGDGRWHHGFYVWPLPPPGKLAFVCEWPAAGIELTRSEIDSEQIRAAAGDAVVLWEEDDRTGPRGGSSMTYLRSIGRESAPTELDARARAWLAENRETLPPRLRELGVATCPACGADELELSQEPLKTGSPGTNEQGRTVLEFECAHCGHLLLFDADKLGFAR